MPKREYKHALAQNLIRRRMKEAYRLYKQLLTGNLSIAFIYIGKEIEDYKAIEKGMKGAFRKMITVR